MTDDLGEIHPCYGLQFRRVSSHPPARLWRAITDPAEVSRWMGHPARIEPWVGGAYSVDFGRTGGIDIDGVIVKLSPAISGSDPRPRFEGQATPPPTGREAEKFLRYAWGTGVVEWSIVPDGTGSRHILTIAGLEPGAIPEDAFAAGWHCQLDDLERYLADGSPRPDSEARAAWEALRPLYAPRAAGVREYAS